MRTLLLATTLLLAMAGCAPHYHPILICQAVAPGIIACADMEQMQ